MARLRGNGITVPIGGDYSELQKKLGEIKTLSKGAGAAIAEAMKGGVGFSQAAKAADQLAASMAKTKANVQALDADFRKAEGQLAAVARAAGISERQFASLAQQMARRTNLSNLENSLRNIQRLTGASAMEMARLRYSMGDAAGAVRGLGRDALASFNRLATLRNAIMAGAAVYGLRDVTQTAMRFDSFQRSFSAISGGTAGAADEMKFIRAEANRLGQDLFVLADSYRGLSAAAMNSGLTQAQVRDVFSAVGEASTTLGLSSDQTKYALYALQQMLSKGVVSMEEMRRQLGDALPGAFKAAARAMGITEREFIKLIESGQLMSTEFLQRFPTELRRTFGAGFAEAAQSAQREFTRLNNAVTESKNAFAQGFLDEMSSSAVKLSAALEDLERPVKAIGEGVGYILTKAAQGFGLFVASSEAMALTFKDWATRAQLYAQAVRNFFSGQGFAAFDRLEEDLAEQKKVFDAYAWEIGRSLAIAWGEVDQNSEQVRVAIGKLEPVIASTANAASNATALMYQYGQSLSGWKMVDLSDSVAGHEKALAKIDEVFLALKTSSTQMLDLDRQYSDARMMEIAKFHAKQMAAEDEILKDKKAKKADIIKAEMSVASAAIEAAIKSQLAWEDSATQIANAIIESARKGIAALSSLAAAGTAASLAGANSLAKQADYADIQLAQREADIRKRGESLQNEIKGYLETLNKSINSGGGGASRAAREAERALKDEYKAKQLLVDLEKEWASLTGQTTEAKIKEIERQANEWNHLANKIKDAEERSQAFGLIMDIVAEKMKAVSDDAMTGLNKAVESWLESNTAASKAAEMFNRTTDAATTFFTDILTGNKNIADSFRNLANTVVAELARIAVQMAVIRPIVMGFSSMLGGGGGGIGGLFGGLVGGIFGGINSAPLGHGGAAVDWETLFNAKGNVFGAPALANYANTVVDSPTLFPFAKGIGLMGEAGAEAIMPLERDSRGRLGVSVADGHIPSDEQSRPLSVTFNLHNHSSTPMTGNVQTRMGPDGDWNFDLIVREVESRIVNNMNRGRSSMTRALEDRWGLGVNHARRLHLRG